MQGRCRRISTILKGILKLWGRLKGFQDIAEMKMCSYIVKLIDRFPDIARNP